MVHSLVIMACLTQSLRCESLTERRPRGNNAYRCPRKPNKRRVHANYYEAKLREPPLYLVLTSVRSGYNGILSI